MKTKWSRTYTDSIHGLTLEKLNRQIESYNNGHLADFALTADAMQERDDVLKNVIAKRKKAVARHGWEVLAMNDSDEARAHQQALEYFYNHLKCTSVLKQDENGGFALLVTQMMDAVAKGFAVHEIAWRPVLRAARAEYFNTEATERGARGNREGNFNINDVQFGKLEAAKIMNCAGSDIEGQPRSTRSEGSLQVGQENVRVQRHVASVASTPSVTSVFNHKSCNVTAELRFVPLWFFEHTTNKLRLKLDPFKPDTEPLDPHEWLVTVGEGVMLACARAYLFKHLPLQSWLDYCQKYGSPGLRAVTTAQRGTPEWDAMTTSLQEFINELAVVTNNSENIQLLDLKGAGDPPYIPLVDRMDRVMIALWRGADLSTLSRNNGYGASLQEGEGRILEADDAKLITETLNNTLDRQVIKMLFGNTVEPLAYVNVLISPREYTAQDLAIDQFLVAHGVALSQSRTLQRYNRSPAEPGEAVLSRQG
ncbi:MAG TPA: DUF935 family protein [Methylomirabilota bacterium]|nr:DUF935 family protein [Methylomirabilota bacterium]